jgi:pimeloyl-ACP methyl ester carboxylesterase
MSTSTKVFVHGNPETSAIWSLLVEELQKRGVKNIVLLTPPGFGAPTPAQWGGTVREYREWLLGELEAIGGDIDLVGHDWGAGHVYGVLAERPDIVRSWAADCAGLLHPEYQWHDAAQGWQAPELGEQMVAGMVAMPADQFVEAFSGLGMTPEIAASVKSHINDDMARCVLSLYRDAVQPVMVELGKKFASAQPRNGLVIIAENDHFAGTEDTMTQVANGVSANIAKLSDVGHWWMCQQPSVAADMLMTHWASVN